MTSSFGPELGVLPLPAMGVIATMVMSATGGAIVTALAPRRWLQSKADALKRGHLTRGTDVSLG